MEGEPRERRPVTGKFDPREDSNFNRDDHHVGWNRALEKALKDINWPPDEYQVQVELGAKIEVENPGHVIEYHVTVI
jgi:hypothetical protein